MKNLFEYTSAKWVRYSDYEYKEKDGILYLLPTEDAAPSVYDPMKDPETLVLKATEIGLMRFKRDTPDKEIQAVIREFACQYGLLGLMTELPSLWTAKRYICRKTSSSERKAWTHPSIWITFSRFRSRISEREDRNTQGMR